MGLRTVYVHFATRAALIEAAEPRRSEGIPGLEGQALQSPRELLYRLQRGFTAAATPSAGTREASPALIRSHEQVAGALRASLQRLAPRDRRLLLNAVLLIADPRSAETATSSLQLDAPETGQLIAWAIEMLLRGATSGE